MSLFRHLFLLKASFTVPTLVNACTRWKLAVPVRSSCFAHSKEVLYTDKLLVEKGAVVWADVFSIHHNQNIWGEDADEFRPKRFDEGVQRHMMVWQLFGAGPRICIGEIVEVKKSFFKVISQA